MGRRKAVSLEEKLALVEEYLAGRLRLREAARRAGSGAHHHGELDQPVSLGGNFGIGGEWESLQTEVQRGLQAPSGGGVPVRSGQFHGHRGKVSFALRESGIGLGKGVS